MKELLQCSQLRRVDSRNKCPNFYKCLLRKITKKGRKKDTQKKEIKVEIVATDLLQNKQIQMKREVNKNHL